MNKLIWHPIYICHSYLPKSGSTSSFSSFQARSINRGLYNIYTKNDTIWTLTYTVQMYSYRHSGGRYTTVDATPEMLLEDTYAVCMEFADEHVVLQMMEK
jgi:hypothetical protein